MAAPVRDLIDLPVVEVGSGRPLLVVHGGPGETHHVLRPHLDALAGPHRRVVYYDQRPLADHRTHVADLEVVRGALGCSFVLGFSWGALLAVLHALEHPVERLVLVSPPPMYDGAPVKPPAPIEGLDGFAAKVAPFLFDPARVNELMPVETREACARAAWSGLRGYDLRGRLRSLHARVLVAVGADDPISTPFAGELASAVGAELRVFPRCGHAPFLEAKGAFVAEVTRFLDQE